MTLDIKTLRRIARTTYRCPRGCVVGFVVMLEVEGTPGDSVPALAFHDGHAWQLESDPIVPVAVSCGHIKGLLPWTDSDPKNVNLSQEDVRSIDPDGHHMHHAEAIAVEPITRETWNKLFGKP
ncbi:hypothetical protein CKALI_06490 [Corynebacterium kalinowskii]|uniref:Uncharacterized protein n=1 Tax=Corynebacterium kalinowskii TaxID=2675216 RepID=A0A6B8VRD8_9CORY|nr:hypothetical protein [Corynebacterium kalinowskii]QGU02167.1 hypothetical protein CKALI_06490 [Corynebacterium kalinowskii]